MSEATMPGTNDFPDDRATECHAEHQGTRIFTGNLFRVRNGRHWAFSNEPPEQAAKRR